VTPDGRFGWTVNTGPRRNTVQISDLTTGQVVQELDDPGDGPRAKTGGVAIAPDGRSAYVSDTRDRILAYAVDPSTGHATYEASIAVSPPANLTILASPFWAADCPSPPLGVTTVRSRQLRRMAIRIVWLIPKKPVGVAPFEQATVVLTSISTPRSRS